MIIEGKGGLVVILVVLLLVISAAPARTQPTAESGGLSESNLPNSVATSQTLNQLGLSPDQLQQFSNLEAQGGLGDRQMQRLCATVAAKHLGPDQIQSIGGFLRLSDSEISQLVDCARLSANGRRMTVPGGGPERQPSVTPALPQTSTIERTFRELDIPYKLLQAPSLEHLTQFGYDLFSRPLSAFAPVDNVPVANDYVVGPGDELNALLWGRVNRTLRLEVQRDGTVLMPQLGPLPVAGLTFAEAKKLIEDQAGQITGVQADVTMGRIRTVQVFVIGQVNQPGLYTVSALSHVSDVLVAAGGMRKTGSLRRIELRRDNKLVKIVDLYAMLLRGDTSADERVHARDVIFVPVIGPVVAVAGDVRVPAIYELSGGARSLAAVLGMAGRVSAFGYSERIQVERIQNHQRRIALDIDLNALRRQSFAVRDGDLVKVFTVLPQREDVVKLKGNVNRAGIYQWVAGMRVADLIGQGQGIADHTYLDYALVKRVKGATRTVHFLPVNLRNALSDPIAAQDLSLQPGDTLTVYSEGEVNEVPTVKVEGAVRKPGTYPLTDGMRMSDLIYQAGGFKTNAYRTRAQLARTTVVHGTARYIYQAVDLEAALQGSDDPPLDPDDHLFIAEANNWHRPWVVQVKGEVMRPGPYVIRQGERLASLLAQSGGLRTDGYLPALILIRQSTKQAQQKSLDQARAALQAEIARAALTPAEGNQQQQANFQQKAQALTMLTGLLTQSAHERAIGRIVLNIKSLQPVANSPDNMVLEDKDEIMVPKKPSWVNVLGEVLGPTAAAYDPSFEVRDYLDRGGGLTRDADADLIFVVKANGAILSEGGLRDSGKNRIFPLLPLISGGLMSAHLDPGDTIYVPSRLIFINPIQRTLDITQIITNSAQGIAYAALLGTLL